MTLHTFSQDLVPVLQFGVSSFGLLSLLLVWWQLRQTSHWNKLQSQHCFLSQYREDLHKKLNDLGKAVGVTLKARKDPLTGDEVKRIWDDDDAYDAAAVFLNDLETLSAAVLTGSVDEDVAYELHAARVFWSARIYAPLIEKFIDHYGDHELFSQLRLVAERWEERERLEKKRQERIRNRHERMLKRRQKLKQKV